MGNLESVFSEQSSNTETIDMISAETMNNKAQSLKTKGDRK